MTTQGTPITHARHARRLRRALVRSACGALVAGVAWSTMVDGVLAAPAPIVEAPILAQSLVGLRQGAVGDEVKAVQKALIAAGVPVPGGADGSFGPATRAALIDFQGRKGLAKSGEVDAATAAALGLAATTSGGPAGVTAVNGLQHGASGDAVKELQQKLSAAGVYVAGGADGQFGNATRTAVSNYQRWNGLTVSGIVDAGTASKLGLSGSSGGTATPPPVVTPPATPTSSNPYVGLAQGARSALVKDLQSALIAAGVTVRGGADGVFGSATKTALVSYQQANGLGASGVVFEATAKKLGLGVAAPDPVAPAEPPPTVTPSTNPYVGLKVGARGALVKDVQSALMAAGITVRGGADGIFGSATKTALVSYQQNHGLTATGEVDAATATKLSLGATPATPAPNPATPPPVASSNPYVGLSVGTSGAKVKELQTALMGTGLVVRGGADGVFGNATKSSLIAFQSVNGIAQTGVLTEKGATILKLGVTTTPTPDPTPNPSGFAGTPDGYPKKGESSERVRVMQQLLVDWKINLVGGADGSFGNATAGALTKFQQTHGLTVTGTVTQQTADKMGLAPSSATPPPVSGNIVMQRFPVQGKCYYGNTWHAPRGGNRLHEGVDIIAAEGNLLYAVVDGTITKQYWDSPGSLPGNGLRVAQDDGTYFTYLHMSGFAPGIGVGTKVKAGDVVGFVGNTGSSATPHVHFEIHPGGGGAVNPYPYVKAIDGCGNTTPQYQSSFAPG